MDVLFVFFLFSDVPPPESLCRISPRGRVKLNPHLINTEIKSRLNIYRDGKEGKDKRDKGGAEVKL